MSKGEYEKTEVEGTVTNKGRFSEAVGINGELWLTFKKADEELKKKYAEIEEGDYIKAEAEAQKGAKTHHIKKLIEHKKGEPKAEEVKEPEEKKSEEQRETVVEVGAQHRGALVQITDDTVPRGAISLAEMGEIIEDINKFLGKNLKEGEDYGVIPGTKKPSLLKPGAEKITRFFGAVAVPVIVEHIMDWGTPFFMYKFRTDIIRLKDGVTVAYGFGSCNSYERKYYDNYSKKYKQDPYFLDNVVMKIAKKRSSVDAVMTLPGVSVQFTQDMEDLVIE